MSVAGLRVLLVEDEAIVAMLLEDYLAEMGCTVVGPAMSLAEATSHAEAGAFDVAILDVNLGGERTDSVADLLQTKDKPYAFATGYGASGLRDSDQDRPILQKPFVANDLENVLGQLAAQISSRP